MTKKRLKPLERPINKSGYMLLDKYGQLLPCLFSLKEEKALRRELRFKEELISVLIHETSHVRKEHR